MSSSSSMRDLLGRHVKLAIRRFGPPGAFLAVNEEDVVLLIGSETPPNAKEGDEIDVFVHLDSEGRPIATTRVAKLEMGEVAFLEVTALTQFGAFVDWGLAKELLVPFGEQTADMRVGSRYAVGLFEDNSGRLAGTMRVSEMLDREKRKTPWQDDEWVKGEAWRDDPSIGLFVILERKFVGLVPRAEPHRLSRGEATSFRITNILRDGKVELSLRAHAHEEIATDAAQIRAALESGKRLKNASTPEEIRDLFGLSKKAFKRAVGRLLKEDAITIDDAGELKLKKR
jgi:uncharacterized protein